MRGFYMKKNRDEFSAPTKQDLQKRVNNICSNPNCRKQTIQPQLTNSNKSTNTGKAAHICAAASGGPRFNSDMTEAERKSIDNAIWLCGPCSEIIDREEDAYSVDLLKKWKKNAESYARLSANQRMYNQTDLSLCSQHYLLNYLKNPQLILSSDNNPFTLNTIAKSITEALLQIDDRIQVNVSYNNDIQSFYIKKNPLTRNLEPVEILFRPLPTLSNQEKWEDFITHGLPIEVQMDTITSNSEALKIIFLNDSDNINARFDKSINQTLIIKDLHDNFVEEFEGKIFIGRDTFSFESKIHQNLLSLNIDKIPNDFSNLTSFMKLNLELELWNNKDLNCLEKFSQIFNFYKKISKLESIKLYALNKDKELFIAKLNINSNELKYVYNLMNYINICRKINQILDLKIKFEKNAEFTSEEHQRLHCIFEDIESGNLRKYEIKNKPSFTLCINTKEHKKNLPQLLKTTNGLQLKKDVKEIDIKMFSSIFDLDYTIECEFFNYRLNKKLLSNKTYKISVDFMENGLFTKKLVNSKVFIK